MSRPNGGSGGGSKPGGVGSNDRRNVSAGEESVTIRCYALFGNMFGSKKKQIKNQQEAKNLRSAEQGLEEKGLGQSGYRNPAPATLGAAKRDPPPPQEDTQDVQVATDRPDLSRPGGHRSSRRRDEGRQRAEGDPGPIDRNASRTETGGFPVIQDEQAPDVPAAAPPAAAPAKKDNPFAILAEDDERKAARAAARAALSTPGSTRSGNAPSITKSVTLRENPCFLLEPYQSEGGQRSASILKKGDSWRGGGNGHNLNRSRAWGSHELQSPEAAPPPRITSPSSTVQSVKDEHRNASGDGFIQAPPRTQLSPPGTMMSLKPEFTSTVQSTKPEYEGAAPPPRRRAHDQDDWDPHATPGQDNIKTPARRYQGGYQDNSLQRRQPAALPINMDPPKANGSNHRRDDPFGMQN